MKQNKERGKEGLPAAEVAAAVAGGQRGDGGEEEEGGRGWGTERGRRV